MVAEESGMKISDNGAAIEPENPLPASAGGQIAIVFDSQGNQETVLESPGAHDGRRPKRQQPRRDVRRTAEYLGERGRLPAEALHLITRRTLAEAVAHIRKAVPGVSHDWAANYYLRCVELLLPYCHVKQADLDQPAGLDGVGGLVAGHFLAASALAQSALSVPIGSGDGSSHRRRLFDSQDGSGSNALEGGDTMPDTTSRAVVTLPPRGRD